MIISKNDKVVPDDDIENYSENNPEQAVET